MDKSNVSVLSLVEGWGMGGCTFLKFIWSDAARDPKTWCDSVWDKKVSNAPSV